MTGIPVASTRSEYAEILLAMRPGTSILIRSERRLNGYRTAARRYGIRIKTARRKKGTMLWVLA